MACTVKRHSNGLTSNFGHLKISAKHTYRVRGIRVPRDLHLDIRPTEIEKIVSNAPYSWLPRPKFGFKLRYYRRTLKSNWNRNYRDANNWRNLLFYLNSNINFTLINLRLIQDLSLSLSNNRKYIKKMILKNRLKEYLLKQKHRFN